FQDAGECYREALTAARETEDRPLAARILNNLGGVYQNLGEPEEAIAYFRQALELQRSLGNEFGEAATLNNLGFYHHGLGEAEEALLCYRPALAIFEELRNRSWQARVLNNIGFAYLALGDFQQARAFLLRALDLRREVGDASGEAVTLRNLGRAATGVGETAEAESFFRQALEKSQATGDRRGEVTAHKLLGELLETQGAWEAARVELDFALFSLKQMGKRAEQAEVLELLARFHLATGNPEGARSRAAEALELHRQVGDPVGQVAARVTMARALRRLDRAAEARRLLEETLADLEGLQGRLGDPSQRAFFLASQRRAYEGYVDLLMDLDRQSPGAGLRELALEASEKARSRSLLALLEGPGPATRVEPALEDRLRRAERRFTAKRRNQLRVLAEEHSEQEARAAELEVFEASTELDGVRAEIRRRDSRYESWTGAEVLDAAGVQALLRDDSAAGETVLLEYFLGEEKSLLWWVSASEIAAYDLPRREEIEALARRAFRRLSEGPAAASEDREVLAELGELLLGPVARRLEGQRLVVVADGALHLIPFAALPPPLSPTTAELPVGALIDRHEVVLLPSASVLARQRKATARSLETVAVLADPVFERTDPRVPAAMASRGGIRPGDLPGELLSEDRFRSGIEGLARLLHTRLEAQAVAAQVPAGSLLLAMDADARRSRVVDGELRDYDVLHFATHGIFYPDAPQLSGLMLSQVDAEGREMDGFLGLHDVSTLELSAQLVVLSGCRTALGKEVRGEGLVGLARGFMYAGVPRV
ncbi:MAG: tetratricopeptide repeat protein, partial [Acidobacteria bacterium]|nr:tetratricopeptide repeat protein [Acidobacteriota bacterium]